MTNERVGVFNPIKRQISEDITVYSDKKIQFRDTGIFIQSSADGKLLISSDGTGADDITLTGSVTMTGDFAMTGDLTITGDLTVTGDFAFGDASADTITMTGDIIWAACSPAYLIDMALASPSTVDIRLSSGGTISNQTTANTITITDTYVDLAVTALRFTTSGNIDGALTIRDNFTVGRVGSEVSFTLRGYQLISGTADYPLDMSGATANTADIRLMNDALIDNTTNGTLTLQTTADGHISISEGTTTIDTDYLDLELTTALRFTSGLNVDGALVFRDAITIGRSAAEVKTMIYGYMQFDGTADYAIQLYGVGSTYATGIDIEDASTTTAIAIGTCTTGITIDNTTTAISVTGTATTGISISGATTDAIDISGACTDGIEIDAATDSAIRISGTPSYGINMGAATTGISIAGTTTTGIGITGNSTTAISVGTGTFATGIALAGTLTAGMTIGTCSGTALDFPATSTYGKAIAIGTFGAPIVYTTDELIELHGQLGSATESKPMMRVRGSTYASGDMTTGSLVTMQIQGYNVTTYDFLNIRGISVEVGAKGACELLTGGVLNAGYFKCEDLGNNLTATGDIFVTHLGWQFGTGSTISGESSYINLRKEGNINLDANSVMRFHDSSGSGVADNFLDFVAVGDPLKSGDKTSNNKDYYLQCDIAGTTYNIQLYADS